jgi:tripartite-type tricarboxylate transporter receptor subunit TctC
MLLGLRSFLLRRVVVLLLLSIIALTVASPLSAQTWPNRPRTMVIPYAPGSSTDLVGRLIASELGAALGQPVPIENMAGVEGIVGVSLVAKMAPDDYQFLLGNGRT